MEQHTKDWPITRKKQAQEQHDIHAKIHKQNTLAIRYLLLFAACSSTSRIFARALLEPPSFGPLGASFAPLMPEVGAGLRCCCRDSSIDS
jgi:hypothetical protein